MAARFAVYYAAPAGSDLEAFGRRWLGSDPALRPAVAGIASSRVEALVSVPRRYGFHATLKAPFRLAEGFTPDDLRHALAAFAGSRTPVLAPPLTPATIGRFVALVPADPAPELDRLAADCVAGFDRFRAPPTAEERARRCRQGLSPRQAALLDRWGYPYVFEEFRFHLTLTDAIPDDRERAEVVEALRRIVAPLCRRPLAVRDVCLFVQPAPEGAFVLDCRCALAGGSGRPVNG